MEEIWEKRWSWRGSLGRRDSRSSSWKMLKVASHSLGRVGDWEQRPCLREFWEEDFLPSLVRGPVECLALRRLAESLRGESLNRFFGAQRERRLRCDLDLPAADLRSSIKAMLIKPPFLSCAEAHPT